MQTFLPYESFKVSAECLDDNRLNNQINEALIILRSNVGFYDGPGWSNHPAARMWKGYEGALLTYAHHCLVEWVMRSDDPGSRSESAARRSESFHDLVPSSEWEELEKPPWLGDEDFHRSHRSNLVRKDPEHYRQFFPNVPDGLDYIWPEVE